MQAASDVASAPSRRVAFTKETLPLAVGNLFSINNYDVEYDVHINGAQVDIVAKSKSDPFSSAIYIEATIEYVDTGKYGKDSTKFLLLRERFPDAKLICLSSTGFTADVKERAAASRVDTMTYDDLFSRFEKFTPYLNLITSSLDYQVLERSYEEPFFFDAKGHEPASRWLNYWRSYAPSEAKWLIVLGEYGTGKTTLTKILQYRWLLDYHANTASPIPIRIELRNFSRQFDARGLLHHFLDTNRLSHVPIEFLIYLIKNGRVILLLDGYDEMAQFLNARERRACLSALAELAADGAKGILTSRPNYFTETEELNVFEALYTSIDQNKIHISKFDRHFIDSEKAIDALVERYILQKYERSLQDLTPEQTRSLVAKKLAKNEAGQKLVLSMLDRVFREELDGSQKALSGKPVIISYLLDIVDDLQVSERILAIEMLTEWDIYKLIVDRLMIRDMQRTAMHPLPRRKVLQKIAVLISGKDKLVADEAAFQDIIGEEFAKDLRPLASDERQAKRMQLFEDLRSSSTLTRATGTKVDGWVFSHNSLREFLVAERLIDKLLARSPSETSVPISTAMRGFVASISDSEFDAAWLAFADVWAQRTNQYELGPYLTLFWNRAQKSTGGVYEALSRLNGVSLDEVINLNFLSFKNIDFPTSGQQISLKLNFDDSSITDSMFYTMDLEGSSFARAVLDNVSFQAACLKDCDFSGAFIFECDFGNCEVSGASFTGLDLDSSIWVVGSAGKPTLVVGKYVLGYLSWNGATTDPIDDFFTLNFHPKISIVRKIIERVSGQRNSQKRGLTQRGEAQIDPPFARDFLDQIQGLGWVDVDRNNLVSVTPKGRTEIQKMLSTEYMPAEIAEFLRQRT